MPNRNYAHLIEQVSTEDLGKIDAFVSRAVNVLIDAAEASEEEVGGVWSVDGYDSLVSSIAETYPSIRIETYMSNTVLDTLNFDESTTHCGNCGSMIHIDCSYDGRCRPCYDDGDGETAPETADENYQDSSHEVEVNPDHDSALKDLKKPYTFEPVYGLKYYSYDPMEVLRENWGKRKPDKRIPLFGVELECQLLGSTHGDLPKKIESVMSGFAICKSDSTTGMRGFEVVSTPATHTVHLQQWKKFFKGFGGDLKAAYYDGCGMHVHVTKAALSPLEIGKLLLFYNDPAHQAEIKSLSGRSQTQYCIRTDHTVTDAIVDPLNAKTKSRQIAVNFQKRVTVELRMFKASTNERMFLGRLETAIASVHFVKKTGIKNINPQEFFKWAAQRRTMYKYLGDYLEILKLIPPTSEPPLKEVEFTELHQIKKAHGLS